MAEMIIVSDHGYFEQNPQIELISCVDLFADAIEAIHEGKSLSKLFK